MFEYLAAQNTILFNVSIISITERDNGFDLLVNHKDQRQFVIPVREPVSDKCCFEKNSLKDFYQKVAILKGLVTMENLQKYAFRKY